MASGPSGRFATYRTRLAAISARTGAPLPSLFLSFGILHEITAVVPLVCFFYGARTSGIGERVVSSVIENDNPNNNSLDSDGSRQLNYSKQKMRAWLQEGDQWAIRVGRRYGIFGYEKREAGTKDDVEEMTKVSGHLAGDVANAVLAYGLTKVCFGLLFQIIVNCNGFQALLPVRIGLSIYLSPMFSRSIVEPIRKTIIQTIRKS